MRTTIDNLVDDCLLHIFNYLDPISCVSAAQVCKRWKELARRTLSKVTDIHLNNSQFCYKNRPRMKINRESTNVEIIKSALQYIGPEVKLIHLGICESDAVVFNGYYSYRILGDYNAEEFISMLSQSCTNIEELQIRTISIDLKFICEQFFNSNRKVKKVILPDISLPMFPSGFDSVEEVIWSFYRDFNVEHFGPIFPNMNKMTLTVNNSPNQIEPIVASILQQIKHLKSINLFISDYYSSERLLRILLDISAFSQLEELQISSDAILHSKKDFEADSVTKLIESCQNLRVVKLHKFGLGTTDVSSFLALPKLEQLEITNVRFFTSESLNKIKLNQFEHLARLRIDFNYRESLNYSGMCDAIGKMPALKVFIVYAIPDERQAVEFTCRVIEKLINDRDIIVSSGLENPFKVYKNGKNPQLRSEPLKMRVRPRGIVHYFKAVHKFVSRLEGCSFVVWRGNDEAILKDWFEEYSELYSYCNCYNTVYSSFDHSDTSENEGTSD